MHNDRHPNDNRPGRNFGCQRAVATAIGLLAVCVTAAGCGNSSARGQAQTSPIAEAAALAFSKCMRAHGLSDFPDPGASNSGPSNSIGGVQFPATIDTGSPAFQTAQHACQGVLSAALFPNGKPQVTASVKSALIAHAQCMRAHGVSGYQDPTFPASGGIAFTDAGSNPQSPAFRHAQPACGTR